MIGLFSRTFNFSFRFPVKIYSTGEDRYFLPDESDRDFKLKLQLPQIHCEQCILQWTYVAGNNWGTDESGNSCTGCRPQETFRACSDIKISDDQNYEPATNKPETTINTIQSTTTVKVEDTTENEDLLVKCHAAGAFVNVPGMDEWCQANCPGFCPSDHCQCN